MKTAKERSAFQDKYDSLIEWIEGELDARQNNKWRHLGVTYDEIKEAVCIDINEMNVLTPSVIKDYQSAGFAAGYLFGSSNNEIGISIEWKKND